jgi:Outer membrane protein beta-barrel domain
MEVLKKILYTLVFTMTFQLIYGQQKKPIQTKSKKVVAKPTIKSKPVVTPKTTPTIPNKTETNQQENKVEPRTIPETPKIIEETKAQESQIIQSVNKETYQEVLNREKQELSKRNEAIRDKKRNANKFGIGLKYGKAMSTISTSEIGSINKKYILGNALGIIFNVPISSKMSLQPEFNYLEKGIEYRYESDYDRLRMNYIAMPMTLKYDFIRLNSLKVYVKLGGYGGYWLNSKLESKVADQISSSKSEFDNDQTDGYKDNRIDYGASGGLGISFKIYRFTLFTEGRFDYGLSNTAILTIIPTDYTKSQNRSGNVCIGVMF